MIARRAMLLGLLAAAGTTRAGAQAVDPFPPTVEAAGRSLVRNGTGTRLYLGIEIYRAALYLERRSGDTEAILAAPGVKLIHVRYRRDVPIAGVALAWEQSYETTCACPLPDAMRHWLRPIRPGDEERYLFLPDRAALTANGGPPTRLDGAGTARTLLAAWIGPGAPTGALRRGLLGAP